MSNTNEQKSLDARQKYILAFNDTIIKIWKEQITLLDVMDTNGNGIIEPSEWLKACPSFDAKKGYATL